MGVSGDTQESPTEPPAGSGNRRNEAAPSPQLAFCDFEHVANFVILEADRRWPPHFRQHGDIVQFFHHAIEAQPMDGVAGAQIDHHEAASWLGAVSAKLIVQGEPLESPILAR